MNISMILVCQYMTILFNFSLNSSHLHPLQVENCDSNSWLVVDEDDNCIVRLQRVEGEGVIIRKLKKNQEAGMQLYLMNCCFPIGQLVSHDRIKISIETLVL